MKKKKKKGLFSKSSTSPTRETETGKWKGLRAATLHSNSYEGLKMKKPKLRGMR